MIKIFTQEIYDFIMENYKGITVPELAKKIEEEFGQPVNVDKLRGYLKRRKLSNGVDTRIGSKKWSEIRRRNFSKKDVRIERTMCSLLRHTEEVLENRKKA